MLPVLNKIKRSNSFCSFNEGFNRAINIVSKFFLMALFVLIPSPKEQSYYKEFRRNN